MLLSLITQDGLLPRTLPLCSSSGLPIEQSHALASLPMVSQAGVLHWWPAASILSPGKCKQTPTSPYKTPMTRQTNV